MFLSCESQEKPNHATSGKALGYHLRPIVYLPLLDPFLGHARSTIFEHISVSEIERAVW